jgi:hypothetical protein
LWSGDLSEANTPHPIISEFLPDGTLVRRIEPPAYTFAVQRGLPRIALAGAFYPLAALPIYRDWLLSFLLQVSPQSWWLFHGWLFGSSFLCAIITVILGRRYGLSPAKIIGWTIANVLLGPAGVVVLLGLHELPVREICAACGKTRLAGRNECSSCHAALPPPSFDGREIFEPADAIVAIA